MEKKKLITCEEMRAVCIAPERGVRLTKVPVPQKAEPGHLVVKMVACAINPGDKAWIAGAFPSGRVPESLLGICGVSGAGRVIEIGGGVPQEYKGRNVAIYRSLKASDNMVGTWCEYTHMHHLHCVILPEDVNLEEYSGSLVNTIAPYVFLKQITEQGHKGVICTAGTSATGRAMLGICQVNDVPIISVVRNQDGKKRLSNLNARYVLVQSDADFDTQLETLANQLNTTAVFDGVGGELASKVAKVLPRGSSIYAYGFLGGDQPLCIHTGIVLMKALTITGFGIINHNLLQGSEKLEEALKDIGGIIDMPHFKTKVGKIFKLEEIHTAMQFSSGGGKKAVLCPFT